jgi:hemerythrin
MTESFVPTELLTGIDEMDAQHDHLFSSMFRVKNALLSVSYVDEQGLSLLAQLLDELLEHFVWEQEAALANGIPFESHAKEHARISAFVRGKIPEIRSGRCNVPALMVFMERSFESHVAHFDLGLGTALRAATQAQRAG